MLKSCTGAPTGPTTPTADLLPLLAQAVRQEQAGRALGDHHVDRVLAHADEDRRAGLTAARGRE